MYCAAGVGQRNGRPEPVHQRAARAAGIAAAEELVGAARQHIRAGSLKRKKYANDRS